MLNKKNNLSEIKEFWTESAKKHGQSYMASWSDKCAIELEIKTIDEYLKDGDNVLDVGCSNGHATLLYAQRKRINVLGLDYAKEMSDKAALNLKNMAKSLKGKVQFDVGDVTALKTQNNLFDKVISTRVIINLGNWENQCKGLLECVRVLKPNGLLLLSEAILQGWNNLNRFRREWNLADIPMPSFNNYLDREKLVSFMSPHATLVEIRNFSSSYYVGTRVLKPMLSRAANQVIDVANPDMELNKWFSEWPPIGDYGIQQLIVFQKKS